MDRQSTIALPNPCDTHVHDFLEHAISFDQWLLNKLRQWHPLHRNTSQTNAPSQTYIRSYQRYLSIKPQIITNTRMINKVFD